MIRRVLFALGIRFVGETVAKNLAAASGSLEKLRNMTAEELTDINEIGERIATSVIDYFSNPAHLQIIEKLKYHGLQFEMEISNSEERTNILNGQTFVISGTFNLHSRDELKQLIELNGGKNVGSISKNTNFVLAGDNMGPSKLEKAKQMKVPIITEEDFLKMIS